MIETAQLKLCSTHTSCTSYPITSRHNIRHTQLYNSYVDLPMEHLHKITGQGVSGSRPSSIFLSRSLANTYLPGHEPSATFCLSFFVSLWIALSCLAMSILCPHFIFTSLWMMLSCLLPPILSFLQLPPVIFFAALVAM